MKDLTTVKQGKATTVQDRSGKCLTEERQLLNRWTEYCSKLYNYKTSGDPPVLSCFQTDRLFIARVFNCTGTTTVGGSTVYDDDDNNDSDDDDDNDTFTRLYHTEAHWFVVILSVCLSVCLSLSLSLSPHFLSKARPPLHQRH